MRLSRADELMRKSGHWLGHSFLGMFMSQKGSCPSFSPFMAGDIPRDIYRDILGSGIGSTNKAERENVKLCSTESIFHGSAQAYGLLR